MIVILGAGLTGLSAAAALERAGRDFVVLEKEGEVGGWCRSSLARSSRPCILSWRLLGWSRANLRPFRRDTGWGLGWDAVSPLQRR